MKEEGLLEKPDFKNVNRYLKSGDRTEVTEEIKKCAEKIDGQTDGMIIRNIMLWINENTTRIHNGSDTRKFKRSADAIMLSGERTGCCDSSTLFTALARSKGIPTMQIITIDKDCNKNGYTSGHFYVGCYLKDINGSARWVLIDSDKPVNDIRDVEINKLNLEDRNISKRRYAFAYTNDYSNIEIDGIKIDCIQNMTKIHKKVYEKLDKKDFEIKLDKYRC